MFCYAGTQVGYRLAMIFQLLGLAGDHGPSVVLRSRSGLTYGARCPDVPEPLRDASIRLETFFWPSSRISSADSGRLDGGDGQSLGARR